MSLRLRGGLKGGLKELQLCNDSPAETTCLVPMYPGTETQCMSIMLPCDRAGLCLLIFPCLPFACRWSWLVAAEFCAQPQAANRTRACRLQGAGSATTTTGPTHITSLSTAFAKRQTGCLASWQKVGHVAILQGRPSRPNSSEPVHVEFSVAALRGASILPAYCYVGNLMKHHCYASSARNQNC
jgi:hypothetical protein